MNFLTSIYEQINSDNDNSNKKATFYSLINYLVANDDSNSTHGIKKKDLEERFSLRKDYSSILEMLIEKDVLEKDVTESAYMFNNQAKQFISPLLQKVLNFSYRDKFKTNSESDCLDTPNIKMLMDCRTHLYSS